MTISTTVTALQTIAVGVTGVTSAPTRYPGSLNSVDLPQVITWPAEGETKGAQFQISIRTYRMAVYIKPSEQGLTGEGWASANTVLQALIEALMDTDNRILVSSGGYTSQIIAGNDRPLMDGGITILGYPVQATGTEGYPHYFGFELMVPVKETWSES